MKKAIVIGLIGMGVLFIFAPGVMAHFQVLIPSTDIVTADGNKTIVLDILFTHPMEQGPVMEMGEPVQFGVVLDGEKQDLGNTLKEKKLEGKTAYDCSYKIKAPGDYVF